MKPVRRRVSLCLLTGNLCSRPKHHPRHQEQTIGPESFSEGWGKGQATEFCNNGAFYASVLAYITHDMRYIEGLLSPKEVRNPGGKRDMAWQTDPQRNAEESNADWAVLLAQGTLPPRVGVFIFVIPLSTFCPRAERAEAEPGGAVRGEHVRGTRVASGMRDAVSRVRPLLGRGWLMGSASTSRRKCG